MTTTYRVSFGSQYSYRPHPTVPQAHPDGWMVIVSDEDELTVRRDLNEWLDGAWSMIYDEAEWERMVASGDVARYWHRGVVAAFTLAEVRQQVKDKLAEATERAKSLTMRPPQRITIGQLRDHLDALIESRAVTADTVVYRYTCAHDVVQFVPVTTIAADTDEHSGQRMVGLR